MIASYVKLMVHLYADDTITMATTKGLQKAIDQMCHFCKKITIFGHCNVDVEKYQLLCNGEELEIVHSFKYLGIFFNYNGSFKFAIEDFHNRASRTMFSLLCKCRKFDLPIDSRLELFDRLVKARSGCLRKQTF